jgi:glycosyltransferase involved in cell wall biosynthesis
VSRPDAPRVSLVIPALDEERSLPLVLAALPPGVLHEVVVVDNGSTDGTARVARELGARVVHEPRRGYGSACLAGLAALDAPDVVAFLDADYSDHPEELPLVLGPVLDGTADLVIGSRTTGRSERGALLPQARVGNRLATALIRAFWGVHFTDLGPFRAIRADALDRLDMRDVDFGWTVEMQVKAARLGLRCREVPVSYRARIGRSKITGTLRGTIRASYRILATILRATARDRGLGRPRVTTPPERGGSGRRAHRP